jgi:CDP-diacylglycerol pyrophosphatase
MRLRPLRQWTIAALILVFASLCIYPALAVTDENLQRDHVLTRRDLWRVIHYVCIPSARLGLPFPCSAVSSTDDDGFAILPVAKGHILTVPTRRISGIESREIFDPSLPNYWAAAWNARRFVESDYQREFDRSDIGLAINSALQRSQDQLHIHTACLAAKTKAALAADSGRIGNSWTRLTTRIDGYKFQIMRIPAETLDKVNVFSLLPASIRDNPQAQGRYTIVVAGAWLEGRKPGFYVLMSHKGPFSTGHGEFLLDFSCRR